MTTPRKLPVLLAVNSSDAADASLAFAVQEAKRDGRGLHLLHVVRPFPTTGQELVVGHRFIGPAQQMLTSLAKKAEEQLAGIADVSWEVAEGPVASTIVERSNRASMVVLEAEDHRTLARAVTGRVRNGVASRAPVPVVCVPPDWSPDKQQGKLVVVGIDDPYHPGALTREALHTAAERNCPLRFLTTWWFAEPYDDVVFTDQRTREWMERSEDALRHALQHVLAEYAHVAVEIVARHQRPADALVQDSARASLLIIGRRDPRLPRGSHIGPVARAVLRRSTCPVMVVDDAAAEESAPRP